jgi:hypothetical protein
MSRTPVRIAALLAATLMATLAPTAAHAVDPPDTAITSGPDDGAVVLPGPVQYVFSSPDVVDHFECSVDNSSFATCTSPVTYNLPAGGHVFRVRAEDPFMQEDGSPASRIWTVRNVACEQAGAAYRAAQGEFFLQETRLGETKTKLQKAKAHHKTGKVKRLKKKIRDIKKARDAAQAAMAAAIAQQHAVC